MTSSRELRVLRALRRGPLYRPVLEYASGIGGPIAVKVLQEMLNDGLVEIATEIGPATYRITEAGRSALG